MPKYSQFWETAAGDWVRPSLDGGPGSAKAWLFEWLRGFGYGGSYAAVRRYAIGWRKEHGAQQGEDLWQEN
jgi:hypothetical protein